MSLSASHAPGTPDTSVAGPAMIDYAAFDAAKLERDPFDHLIVPNFLTPAAVAAVNRDYPEITGPANFKLADLDYGPAFADFVEELAGPELTRKMAAKFEVDLPSDSTSITARKFCEQTDGNIHVDHRTKVIAMLVYFNETWEGDGGRFRILHSALGRRHRGLRRRGRSDGRHHGRLPAHRQVLPRSQALRRRTPHGAVRLGPRGDPRAPGKALEPTHQAPAPLAEHELKDGPQIPNSTRRATVRGARDAGTCRGGTLPRRLQRRSTGLPPAGNSLAATDS
jgi:hypothetical protein